MSELRGVEGWMGRCVEGWEGVGFVGVEEYYGLRARRTPAVDLTTFF